MSRETRQNLDHAINTIKLHSLSFLKNKINVENQQQFHN